MRRRHSDLPAAYSRKSLWMQNPCRIYLPRDKPVKFPGVESKAKLHRGKWRSLSGYSGRITEKFHPFYRCRRM